MEEEKEAQWLKSAKFIAYWEDIFNCISKHTFESRNTKLSRYLGAVAKGVRLVLEKLMHFESEVLNKVRLLTQKALNTARTVTESPIFLDTQHITKSVVVQYGGRDEYISKS